jgi:glucose 1-dehydrogenase
MVELKNKVALITGASRGIGRATAVEMATAGANVTINYHSHGEEAEEVAKEVRGLGCQALTFGADVSDRSAVEAMVNATVQEFGHLDVLVSNAYYSKREPFLELSTEAVERTWGVTLWGAFHSAQLAARQMAAQGNGGAICFISSVLAHVPMPTSLPYNSAKAGINQMSRTIANEMTEHQVRSNVIEPGWIDTPGERQYTTDEEMKTEGAKLPWGRLGTPDEIAKAATYLCSDAASYVTGSVLRVDGGFCIARG